MKLALRNQNPDTRIRKLLNIALITVLSFVSVASPIQAFSKRSETCPSDVETLMTRMLKDLPGYSNRVAQRSRIGDRSVEIYNYILVAGNPEFEPLPLSNLQYEPELPDETKQVFFTTLERQYTPTEAILLQNYYWLFLTPTSEGWRLVLLFSQLADLEQGDLPLPPQNAMNGAIGQGIKLWLKDCRAGVLKQ
ncbi:hypothetical protein [Crocosphaera subtropica]|nr:hypothetical protein [Crocosphaera subtropica]